MYTMYTNSKTAADTRFIWYTWTLILMYTSCIPCIPTGAAALILVTITQELGAMGYPTLKKWLVCVKGSPRRCPDRCPQRERWRGISSPPRSAPKPQQSRTAQHFAAGSPFCRITPQNSLRAAPFLACYAVFTL